MEAWWTAVATAVGWAVLVALWSVLTRHVANVLVVLGLLAAVGLAVSDHRFGWHALGFAAAVLPSVALFAAQLIPAGTAKGFGALGAILGLASAPAIVAILGVAVAFKKRTKRVPTSTTLFFAAIALAIAMYQARLLPPSMM